MKTSTTTALASILRTTAANCTARARALKLTASCRRCEGSGSYAYAQPCYDCGGSGHVLAADATERATAMVASGELDAYVARVAAKKTAQTSDAADAAAKHTATEARITDLRARYAYACESFARHVDTARALGLNDAIARASAIATEAARFTAPCVAPEARLTRAVWAIETLTNAFASYVLDHDAEVIAARAFAAACREADGHFVEVTIYG